MELSVFVEIEKPIEDVWKAIVDFENCTNYISAIVDLKIIDKPADTLIGFKWKETRIMFGKEATETMWITDYAENDFYQTRAESHGSIYISRLSLEHVGENTKLTMSFTAEAQKFFVKIMSVVMGFMMKGSMKKALVKDLNDIKNHLETK
jgi:uncharacterized protein YndB with AHSA1/START domain